MNNNINDDLYKLIYKFILDEKIIITNYEDFSKRLTEKILTEFIIYKNIENTKKIYTLEILPEKYKEKIENNIEDKEKNTLKIDNLKVNKININDINLDNDIKEIINMDNESLIKKIKNKRKKNIEDQINIESIINIKNEIDINDLDVKNDIENIKQLIYKDKCLLKGKRLRNVENGSKVYLFLDYIIRICNDTQCKNEYQCLNKFGLGLNKKVNIVMPYYVELDNKELNFDFSIQPYIKNTITLDEYVKLKKYTNEILIKHFYELCKIIEYMHNKEIVHGDLKPNNILINNHNDLYLIDYGLSGLDKISTGTGGTKPFCAPETLNTSETQGYIWRQNKKENDIWSIGMIFITIFLFNSIYHYYSDYPKDFFDSIGYINEKYFNNLDINYHELFKCIFKKNRSNISDIKNMLKKLL